VRITIDTREDSYEDALGVLRRAYGRHRVARKTGESPAAVNSSGGGRPGAKRTSAARATAVEAPVSKSTGKRAVGGGKAARTAPTRTRPGATRKRAAAGVAANTAPRGESEAVRAWARDQGMQVRSRGRMPAKVIAAYLAAHAD
jgi:hypothetical protein